MNPRLPKNAVVTDRVIHDIGIVLAPTEQAERGLLAYASVLIGPWRLAGLRVRRLTSGELIVVYPSHRSITGARDPYVAPLEFALTQSISTEVIAEYLRVAARAERRSE